MDAMLLLTAAGSIGLFSARAFVPAFLAALFMRYGHEIPYVSGTALIQAIGDAPTWFTHDITLALLGGLALLEVAAQHQPDARRVYDEVSAYAKSAMGIATTLGVGTAADRAFVEEVIQQAGVVDTAVAAGVGLGVFGVGSLRSQVLRPLAEADEDDDLGLQGLWAWVEDFWASFGMLILIVAPIALVVITAGIVGVLSLLRRRARRKEERAMTPCPNCETMRAAHASACPACRTPVEQPRAVGFFGQPRDDADGAPAQHDLALLEKRRCPVCASRLEQRRPRQACSTCRAAVFEDPAVLDRYRSRIGDRLVPVTLICAVLGTVPIVGLIAGVITYRLKLVAPWSRYLPWRRSLVRRVALRVVLVVLGLLQLIPLVGLLTVPGMALLSFVVYRSAFEKTLARGSHAVETEYR